MTLTVSASALLGLNPGNDPFLMTVIASYSLGHVTKVSQKQTSSHRAGPDNRRVPCRNSGNVFLSRRAAPSDIPVVEYAGILVFLFSRFIALESPEVVMFRSKCPCTTSWFTRKYQDPTMKRHLWVALRTQVVGVTARISSLPFKVARLILVVSQQGSKKHRLL